VIDIVVAALPVSFVTFNIVSTLFLLCVWSVLRKLNITEMFLPQLDN